MAAREDRTVAAVEEHHTGLGLRHIAVVAAAHHTALEGVLRTVLAEVHHTGPVAVHHTGPAEDPEVEHTALGQEAVGPIAAAEVELHTDPVAVRRTGPAEAPEVERIALGQEVVGPIAAAVGERRIGLEARIVDSALEVARSLGEVLAGIVAAGRRAGPDRVAARTLREVGCMPLLELGKAW